MHLRPVEQFTLINKNRLSWSADSLVRFYLPIVGHTAIVLYQYLTTSDSNRVSDVLNHLNIGLVDFNNSLDKLSAMGLLDIFTDKKTYQFELKSPKSPADFLADDFYSRLLLSKLGDQAFNRLAKLEDRFEHKLSKKFSEVFKVNFSGSFESLAEQVPSEQFDLASFKNIMKQQQISFTNESAEVLRLYEIAEKYSYNWYELFKLAEKTMNANRTLNLEGLIASLNSQNQDQIDMDSFTSDEKSLVLIAKTMTSLEFLTALKNQENLFITNDERKLLIDLSRNGLADEVQNILIHYSLIQSGMASLNEKFLEKVVADWNKHRVISAEGAMRRIIDFRNEMGERANGPKGPDQTKSSAKVPDWHEGVQDKTSEKVYSDEQVEKLKKLEELRQEALKRKREASN
ncbi:DnaD domain protein [Streptococcaceae bacterium ESL0729]|nr:DnaD domain protein [Streptococcaceae bacterium ESL0729]